jgi:ATP-dependent DNA ligase
MSNWKYWPPIGDQNTVNFQLGNVESCGKFTYPNLRAKQRPKPNAAVRWVTPELVREVSFSCWTQDGMMRHPVFHGLKSEVLATTVRQRAKANNLSGGDQSHQCATNG